MYIDPTINDVRALMAQKAEYDNVLEKARELQEKRDAILAEYNSISQEDLDKLNKLVPQTFDSVFFLNELNIIASKYGLTLSSYKENTGGSATDRAAVVEEGPEIPYVTNKISIKVTGPYPQFLSFLEEVETNLRLVDVSSLSIKNTQQIQRTATGGVSQVGGMEYLLDLNTYSLR